MSALVNLLNKFTKKDKVVVSDESVEDSRIKSIRKVLARSDLYQYQTSNELSRSDLFKFIGEVYITITPFIQNGVKPDINCYVDYEIPDTLLVTVSYEQTVRVVIRIPDSIKNSISITDLAKCVQYQILTMLIYFDNNLVKE